MFHTKLRTNQLFLAASVLLPQFAHSASVTIIPVKEETIPLMPKEIRWGMTREEAEANTTLRELKSDTAPTKPYGVEKFEAFNTEFRLVAHFADGMMCPEQGQRGNGLCRIALIREGECPAKVYDPVKEYFSKETLVVGDFSWGQNGEAVKRLDVNERHGYYTSAVILYCNKKNIGFIGINISLKYQNR